MIECFLISTAILRKVEIMNHKCFRCETYLTVLEEGRHKDATVFPNVSCGVVFRTTGQYGSTIWDECAGFGNKEPREIQIILCDKCLATFNWNVDIVGAKDDEGNRQYESFTAHAKDWLADEKLERC